MRIGSIKENQNIEKRIAITPETIKKYSSLGLEICLSKNYGSHLGISDDEYSDQGVKFSSDDKEVINHSNIVVQLGLLSDDKRSLLKEDIDVELHDMVTKELFEVRESRRSIV